MSIANKPDEQIFASQAKRNEIDNFPDMLRGWGITFEQTEGIPPMEWFNFLFKRIDENLLYHLQRGLPEWSATLDYPKGAYVQHQGKTYRALMQNKNSPPNTADTDKWKRWAIDLDEINEFIRTNQKSSATDSESEDTVATSKAVYDLNGIKLDKVGGEAFLKTIDYTKANGYTYSGFYRPNGDRLNNLPLNGLMMHITHPHYSTNAHARGICFAYGSLTGNIAWDIFTTAFDANGNHLDQKRIMTELGGTFTGNVTAPNLTATGLINITGNRWERVRATLPDGGYWRWEVNPASKDDPRFNFMYRFANGDTRYVAFPRVDKNETVAYQSWVEDKAKNLIPVGAVMAFPSAVQNPHGFLRCDGSSFGQETYPALYQALGVNTLPDLRRSDVGMTAYFATDNIPEGWIAFDDIEEQVSEQAYPELYRHLVAKYGSLSAVPKAKDRFIRNAGGIACGG